MHFKVLAMIMACVCLRAAHFVKWFFVAAVEHNSWLQDYRMSGGAVWGGAGGAIVENQQRLFGQLKKMLAGIKLLCVDIKVEDRLAAQWLRSMVGHYNHFRLDPAGVNFSFPNCPHRINAQVYGSCHCAPRK